MLDIKWIRENAAEFDAAMAKRNNEIKAENLLKIDEEKRKKTFLIQELQAKRNKFAQEIAGLKSLNFIVDGLSYPFAKFSLQNLSLTQKIKSLSLGARNEETDNLILKYKNLIVRYEDTQNKIYQLLEESKKNNAELAALENDFSLDEQLNNILLTIPNIPHASVPVGVNEDDNIEIEKFGIPKTFSFKAKSHDELGENLKMLDFEQSVLMSGARFSTLSGHLARLERALSNFMLDVAQKNGYIEVSPPNLVRDNAMINSGQLPKFADEAFVTTNGYWLIPTAEVSLVNMVAKKTLLDEQLPIRYTAFTPCFRSEAGSAGKDTKGLIRQHQFKKVELVSITTAESSNEEHERMTNVSCEILRLLELPFRKILLCTGDMGFAAQKTYDLEVWLPSQEKYREISSCSNCGDFQARRAAIKYKAKDGKAQFAHTLNGSALAVGRTLLAIMENYQNEDGSITVPQVLLNYMGGIDKICLKN